MRLIFLYALCSLLLVATVARTANAQSDRVDTLRGAPTSGIVDATQTTKTELAIDDKGTVRRIPVNEIKRVTFTDDPKELSSGRDSVLTGQLEAGYDTLRKVDAAAIKREIVKADLQFYLAYCQGKLALTGGGDKAAAATAMLNFVKTYPNSFHFFEAAEVLGDLASSLQSYDSAVKYYGAIATQAPWPDYKLRGAVLEARAYLQQENYAEAKSRFDQVVASTVDTPEATQQKLMAQAGQAVCAAGLGNADEAIKLAEDIISKHSPEDNNELFGRAYNAQGTAYLKAGKQKEALIAFLHTDVLFYSHPEVHAEAL